MRPESLFILNSIVIIIIESDAKSSGRREAQKGQKHQEHLRAQNQQSHEDFRPFECEYCNLSFYQEVELFFHTCNFLSSLHQCSMCYISFESLKALKSHSKVHKKSKKKKNDPRKGIAIIHESKEHNIKKPPIKKIRLSYEEIKSPDKDF